MRLRPLLVYILSALIWTARGVEAEKPVPEPQEEPQETVRVFEHAVTDSEAAELEHLIQRGQKTSCCGYWAERGAAKMQQLVARQLQISRRHLGDVHFDNITAVRAVRDEHSLWSGIAVLYLEDLESSQVQLQSDRHEVEILDVTRGSLVQVPEGAVLVHTKPLRVAWTRVRAPDAPMRGFFEFYLASWVQRHFVMPYDTTQQRKFFRKHTRHPRYRNFCGVLLARSVRSSPVCPWPGSAFKPWLGPARAVKIRATKVFRLRCFRASVANWGRASLNGGKVLPPSAKPLGSRRTGSKTRPSRESSLVASHVRHNGVEAARSEYERRSGALHP